MVGSSGPQNCWIRVHEWVVNRRGEGQHLWVSPAPPDHTGAFWHILTLQGVWIPHQALQRSTSLCKSPELSGLNCSFREEEHLVLQSGKLRFTAAPPCRAEVRWKIRGHALGGGNCSSDWIGDVPFPPLSPALVPTGELGFSPSTLYEHSGEPIFKLHFSCNWKEGVGLCQTALPPAFRSLSSGCCFYPSVAAGFFDHLSCRLQNYG